MMASFPRTATVHAIPQSTYLMHIGLTNWLLLILTILVGFFINICEGTHLSASEVEAQTEIIMADTNNPMSTAHNRHDYGHEHVSTKEYHIAGILVTVYGLEELPNVKDVACLWLMHPRLQKHTIMAPVAAAAINAWNKKLEESPSARSNAKGLIAVSFDQRNHGTRRVSKLANESWKQGNPTHAIDMFSIFRTTSHSYIYRRHTS